MSIPPPRSPGGKPDPGTDAGTADRPLPQYPIESVDRTLALLELLGSQPEVKLAEVRDRLRIGQSTAHRLMAMLVYRGFAVQNGQTRAYRAGPTLFRLGHSAVGEPDIIRYARQALEWAAEQSGETAHFGVLAGTEVRYLDMVESTAVLRVTGRVGEMGPAHSTSLGKAMLATLDDAELARRYRTEPLAAELMAEIGRTRARGWARNREEMQSGVCSVGIALVHPERGLLGALNIATPKARSNPSTEREHAGLLRVAAARLVARVP